MEGFGVNFKGPAPAQGTGASPLHIASAMGFHGVVELLLAARVDSDKADQSSLAAASRTVF